ncbi:MAG: hypothetical protein Q7W29_07040 [bacterium]|nr:hypothetical protein [bacterium]
MTSCQKFLCSALLLGACALASPAHGAAPAFAAKVTAIEAAQSAELTRLGEAIATAADPAEALALQRCAAYVKNSSRLALQEARLEAQLEAAPDDSLRTNLAVLVEDLRVRVEDQRTRLPAGYAFTPAAPAVQEVPPCAE